MKINYGEQRKRDLQYIFAFDENSNIDRGFKFHIKQYHLSLTSDKMSKVGAGKT